MQGIKGVVHSVEGKIAELKFKEPTQHDLKPGEKIIKGYTCFAPATPLKLSKFILSALGEDEVEVKTSVCSVCHTDLSMIRNELGMTEYPFVPGHEMVGTITAIGDRVPASANLKIGQRVGVGFFKRSCHTCEFCCRGAENICPTGEPIMAIKGNRGGFSEFVHLDYRWAINIPDSIPSEFAAPLLCAGITVYAPLRNWNAKPNWKVGIIGMGGLGHLFVKMAKNIFGCEVYVFSHSEEKELDAMSLGADHFVKHNDKPAMMGCQEKLDFILNTVYYNLDWKIFLDVLKPDGIFCSVGFPSRSIEVPIFPLVYKQRKVVGSNVGPPGLMKEMMEECAKHNIRPEIESYSIHECEKVLNKFETEGIFYRAVLRVDGEYERQETEIKTG